MSKAMINESSLTSIGDAIREKTSSSTLLLPSEMPAAIRSISGGGGGGDLQYLTLYGFSSLITNEVGTTAKYGGVGFNVNLYDYIDDVSQIESIMYSTGRSSAGYNSNYPYWMYGFWDKNLMYPMVRVDKDGIENENGPWHNTYNKSNVYCNYYGHCFVTEPLFFVSQTAHDNQYGSSSGVIPYYSQPGLTSFAGCIKDNGQLWVGLCLGANEEGTEYFTCGRTYSSTISNLSYPSCAKIIIGYKEA